MASRKANEMEKIERRELLKKLAVGSAVVAIPALASAGSRREEEPLAAAGGADVPSEVPRRVASASLDEGVDGPPPWELLAPVTSGTYVGSGWSVAGMSPLNRGTAILFLARRSGETARVNICRRFGAPRGVAHTDSLDFLLMNGADGDRPTSEALGRAIKTVAMRVSGGGSATAAGPALGGLLPHSARLAMFGPEEISA
jgi:hypothetical protein